jgi:hypothetical protein
MKERTLVSADNPASAMKPTSPLSCMPTPGGRLALDIAGSWLAPTEIASTAALEVGAATPAPTCWTKADERLGLLVEAGQ